MKNKIAGRNNKTARTRRARLGSSAEVRGEIAFLIFPLETEKKESTETK
jgi:hypothetical protein